MKLSREAKPVYQFTDWEVKYNEPGDCYVLIGRALNDARFNPLDPYEEFADGHRIQTSMLLNIDYIDRTAETANSVYKLIGNGKMEIEIDIKPIDPELKCPKCGEDMKEYVTRFMCRNIECRFDYTKQFQFRG
jgi:hypothetical protein